MVAPARTTTIARNSSRSRSSSDSRSDGDSGNTNRSRSRSSRKGVRGPAQAKEEREEEEEEEEEESSSRCCCGDSRISSCNVKSELVILGSCLSHTVVAAPTLDSHCHKRLGLKPHKTLLVWVVLNRSTSRFSWQKS